MGVRFTNQDLLRQSLTHSSFSNEKSRKNVFDDNERLEFLGDAVIGLVVAEKLMQKYPNAAEGKLSQWRSTLVSRKALADCAGEIGLSKFIHLGKGEESSGGREKTSILAGAFEAFTGAVYLDQGFDAASKLLEKVFAKLILELEQKGHAVWRSFDRKTHLQERTQRLFNTVPNYRLVDSWGLEHEKSFRVEIELQGKIIAEGEGKSKKEAEQNAAERALDLIEENA